MLERRHPLRRGLCGGIVLGALAGLISGAVSALCLDGPVRLFAELAALHAGVASFAGAGVGFAMAAAEGAIESLARQRTNRPRAAATLYTLGATPLVAALGARVTDGIEPRWAAPVVGAAALLAVFLVTWMCLRIGQAIDWRASR